MARRTRHLHAWAPAAAVLAAVLAAGACGNGAVGVDACKQVEEARCRAAPACGIELEPPYHTSGNDVDACIRFYDVACLHGLTVGYPGSASVSACVSAVESGDCALVQSPATGACAWLAPMAIIIADASQESEEDAAAATDGGDATAD